MDVRPRLLISSIENSLHQNTLLAVGPCFQSGQRDSKIGCVLPSDGQSVVVVVVATFSREW